jgi:hypothetical protein
MRQHKNLQRFPPEDAWSVIHYESEVLSVRLGTAACVPNLATLPLVRDSGSARAMPSLDHGVFFASSFAVLLRQLVEENSRSPQIERVKTLGEPAVCWSEEIARLIVPGLFGP